ADKAGRPAQQFLAQGAHFVAVIAGALHVFVGAAQRKDLHPPADATDEGRRLVMLEVVFGLLEKHVADGPEGAGDLLMESLSLAGRQSAEVASVGHEFLRQLVWRQDTIGRSEGGRV